MIDSLILNENEKEIFIKLMNKSNKNIGNEFELIYRASRDGWDASNFHKKCDGKMRTIHLIHTETDNIFGGYSSKVWQNGGGWQSDENAFLFLIKSSNKKYKPDIFNINLQYTSYALYHASTVMCRFGGGADLFISSNCNQYKNSYTEQDCFDMPTTNYLNGDIEQYFKVKQYEIFCAKK